MDEFMLVEKEVIMDGTTPSALWNYKDFDSALNAYFSILNAQMGNDKVNAVICMIIDGMGLTRRVERWLRTILEYPSREDFPKTGEEKIRYIDKDTNKAYKWNGTAYVEIV